MKEADINNKNHLGFPSFLDYQCRRLIPMAKVLVVFSIFYLLGFGVLDFYRHPSYLQQSLVFRVLASLPLMLLLFLMNAEARHHLVPKYFALMGLLSFSCYLALSLFIPEKNQTVVLVPIIYILVTIAMAPLVNTPSLVTMFLVGVVVFYGASVTFISDQNYVILMFPQMASIALFTLLCVFQVNKSAQENYALAKNLHWQSLHDDLTKVFNRKGVFNWIEAEKLFIGKPIEPVSLVMLDFDHFKQINDKFGHAIGDEVIKQGAQLIFNVLGNQSVVARFGGEEFLLVLQQGSEAKNLRTAETILAQFRGLEIISGLSVSVSMGFVNHRIRHSFEQSLKAADDSMYQAKSLGRNQLVVGQV